MPESVLSNVLSCSLVEDLLSIPDLDFPSLVSSIPTVLTQAFVDHPEILDCLPTELLPMLASIPGVISDIPSSLLVKIIMTLPNSELELLLSDSSILTQMSPSSIKAVITEVLDEKLKLTILKIYFLVMVL